MFLDDTMEQNEVQTLIDQDGLVAAPEVEEDRMEHAVDHIEDHPAEILETNRQEVILPMKAVTLPNEVVILSEEAVIQLKEAVILPEHAVILINYLFCNK